MHSPPQGTFEHCAVGVGFGDGSAGRHSQLPLAVTLHWPRSLCAPSQGAPGGQEETLHGPPQAAASHGEGGVGRRVGVGGGVTGTHAQLPASSEAH